MKLSKKEAILSVLVFVACYFAVLLTMFVMIAINLYNADVGIGRFLREHADGEITVAVSTAILSFVIYCYFFFENKQQLTRYSRIAEIFLLLCISLLFCNIIGKFVNPTARPLLFFALMASMFLRRRDAMLLNSVFMLLIFIFNRFLNSTDIAGGSIEIIESFASLLTIFCAGIMGIFLLKKIKTRLGCVMITFALLVPVLIINLVMQLPVSDNLTFNRFYMILFHSAMDCVFSVLFFMFLLPVFEALFSELTPFRLRELTADNAKLIKRLKANALGTYNHSIVVAQLAEACASAIGEDAELARAVAYYHDIGKLKNPEMFTENQSEYDLHKEITPELSVDIIRSHAKDGAQLIRKHRLPEIFADVAIQHHGTMPIKYFYAKALKMSDGELNAGNYSYAGPTPTTKIAAIIMIADASEAASRSLKDRSPEKVEALVKNLVEERMNMDQFVDCDITMRELTVIIRTVVNSLTGVYHARVAYPKLVLSKK